MPITVHIENHTESDDVPDPSMMRRWISAALKPHVNQAELSVQVVTEQTMTEFNSQYRGKPTSTNVLSFPAELPDFVDIPLLGDIIVCADVIGREALEQHKSKDAHWAHMLVHGSLHLLGYDHQNEREAQEMESLETVLITALGFPSPYEITEPATMSIRNN